MSKEELDNVTDFIDSQPLLTKEEIEQEYKAKLSTIRNGLYTDKDDEELQAAVKIVENAKIVKAIQLVKLNKTNGRRNIKAGHKWELEALHRLEEIFPEICTTRLNSRLRDSQKVDIMYKDEAKHGRLPYNIQCKTLAKHCDYTSLLKEMPVGDEVNVIIHRKTKKSEASGRFIKQGTYAIMEAEDFYKLIQELENYRTAC